MIQIINQLNPFCIMKTKKYLLAFAIFYGMVFAAQATNIIDLNDQTQTQVRKSKITKIPPQG